MKQIAPQGWAAAVLAVLLAGCGERPPEGKAPSATDVEAAEAGYLAPPQAERVEAAGEQLVVGGSAPAGDRVRIGAVGGQSYSATADAQGRWEVRVSRTDAAQMFTIVAEREGRALRGEGRLLVLPGGPHLILRPGHGALPVGPAPQGGPRIVSLDIASDGAAAVSGYAQPSTRAATVVDGVPPAEGVVVGQGATDRDGRFAIILATPLQGGEHSVVVNTPDGVARVTARIAPTPELGGRPFVATRDPEGWRITWRLPRGGVQTTYVPERPA